jgi:hypothetical protein
MRSITWTWEICFNNHSDHLVGTVASMTEDDPGAESENSKGVLGKPGQRHEAGTAFGC